MGVFYSKPANNDFFHKNVNSIEDVKSLKAMDFFETSIKGFLDDSEIYFKDLILSLFFVTKEIKATEINGVHYYHHNKDMGKLLGIVSHDRMNNIDTDLLREYHILVDDKPVYIYHNNNNVFIENPGCEIRSVDVYKYEDRKYIYDVVKRKMC